MMDKDNNVVWTLVLVGRTGNGKSASGNTILGRKAFKSKTSSSTVTKTCELQQTVLEDGQIINVVDTPGLFDSSVGIEFIGKEILRCIDLAKDGFHAILLVFSVKTRFTEEEAAVLHCLKSLFGNQIINYIIIAFTGGDELAGNGETLEEYLGHDCPNPLKDILMLCGNRLILFDNKTKNEPKRKAQVRELLSLINSVVNQNGGKPYTNELFAQIKKRQEVDGSLRKYDKGEIFKLEEQMRRTYEDLLKKITDMVDTKLRETIARLEQKLAEEQAARKRLEEHAQVSLVKANEEIRKLKGSLEKARKELKDLHEKDSGGGCCTIM